MNSRQKQQPLDPCDEARGGREPYLTPVDDTRSQSPELSRESAVTTYRFTIEGEVTADSAPDAYQAISELFDRMAEAQRSDALLRFALGDKVRVTLTPASNLTGFVMSREPPPALNCLTPGGSYWPACMPNIGGIRRPPA